MSGTEWTGAVWLSAGILCQHDGERPCEACCERVAEHIARAQSAQLMVDIERETKEPR